MTFPRRTFSLFAGLAVLGAALAGCGGGDMPPSEQIFVEPPWDGEERYIFNLSQDQNDDYGTCEMLTEPEGDGTATLSLLCGNEAGDRDDYITEVEEATLTPIASERTNVNTDRERTLVWTSNYEGDMVTVSTRQDGDLQAQRERDLPTEPEDPEDPQPGYYDDNSLFWLVRGIDLSLGTDYDKAFDDVSAASQVQIIDTQVTIEDEETIEVPAGTFETWRIRLQTSDVTQRIWVTQEAPHLVVRAQFENTEFRLAEIDQGA